MPGLPGPVTVDLNPVTARRSVPALACFTEPGNVKRHYFASLGPGDVKRHYFASLGPGDVKPERHC
jgi:hypothetical protein